MCLVIFLNICLLFWSAQACFLNEIQISYYNLELLHSEMLIWEPSWYWSNDFKVHLWREHGLPLVYAGFFYQLLSLSWSAIFWGRSGCWLSCKRKSYNFCHSDYHLPIFCHTTIWAIFFYKNIFNHSAMQKFQRFSLRACSRCMHKLSQKHPNCLRDYKTHRNYQPALCTHPRHR